eukprot:2455855-Amphidinium_carterae.2
MQLTQNNHIYLKSQNIMMDQVATQQSQSSGQVCGLGIQVQSPQSSLVPSWTSTTSKMPADVKASIRVMSKDVVRSGHTCMTKVLQYQWFLCHLHHVPLQPIKEIRRFSQSLMPTPIHGFKTCAIISEESGLRVHFHHSYASCQITWSSTMEVNQCYAIVKPPLQSTRFRAAEVRSMHQCLENHTMASVGQT